MIMAWYNTFGKDGDVAISSRIRFARNIADYPFVSRLSADKAREICAKTAEALGDGYTAYNFEEMKPDKALTFLEKHYVSPEFISSTTPRVLLQNGDASVSVMVNEEDHIRLQCITAGFTLDEAYKKACEADDRLSEKLNIAFDDKLGYLTHCPTNLGTGMRASVMLFLPALTMTKQIGVIIPQLSKIGLTLRGSYGEGSEAVGALYQVSNQITLGVSEEDTLKKLGEVITQLIGLERQARSAIRSDSPDDLEDRVLRSLGIMKYAKKMSSGEFMEHFADIRLGLALGIIGDGVITYEKLGEMMVLLQPATLSEESGRELDEAERDKLRAKKIREYFKQ